MYGLNGSFNYMSRYAPHIIKGFLLRASAQKEHRKNENVFFDTFYSDKKEDKSESDSIKTGFQTRTGYNPLVCLQFHIRGFFLDLIHLLHLAKIGANHSRLTIHTRRLLW